MPHVIKNVYGDVFADALLSFPPAARAEAEHWNATSSELDSWHAQAKQELKRLQTKVSNSDETPGSESQNDKSLEDRAEKVKKIIDYVEALKIAANKEKKSSEEWQI